MEVGGLKYLIMIKPPINTHPVEVFDDKSVAIDVVPPFILINLEYCNLQVTLDMITQEKVDV